AETRDPLHLLWAGSVAMFFGDGELGGKLYERSITLARERGALGALAPALAFLALQRHSAQQFDQAALAAAEAEQFAREVGAETLLVITDFVLAFAAAVHGDDEETARRADHALKLARAHGLPVAAVRPHWALAMLDLGRGRWADAVARLESMP